MIKLITKILEPFGNKDADYGEKTAALCKIGIIGSIAYFVGKLTGSVIKHLL